MPEQSDGIFECPTDSKIATEQKGVHNTIIRYQSALNARNTGTILGLFADESYSQWDDKLTTDGTEKHQGQHDDLFKREKSETDSALDSIRVNGDTAVVRIHHHVGSVVTNFKGQKIIIDPDREVSILSKISGGWKTFLYTFNANPL